MLDNAFTPPMYRDTMSPCVNLMPYIDYDMLDCGCVAEYTPMAAMANMGGMGIPMAGCGCYGGYQTNLLGNTKLKPQPNKDTVIIAQQSKEENKSALKKALIYAGAFIGAAAIIGLFKGKYVSKFFKGLFKGSSATTPTTPPVSGGKKWYNPFTWFKKSTP